ncbi:hypothetical protein MKEN_01151200 [Mycena kentingensis (nom. inval.)]|nr:hypothetical protein MKEN_01151200 [Mycena kentingensis (nom. inval.)]
MTEVSASLPFNGRQCRCSLFVTARRAVHRRKRVVHSQRARAPSGARYTPSPLSSSSAVMRRIAAGAFSRSRRDADFAQNSRNACLRVPMQESLSNPVRSVSCLPHKYSTLVHPATSREPFPSRLTILDSCSHFCARADSLCTAAFTAVLAPNVTRILTIEVPLSVAEGTADIARPLLDLWTRLDSIHSLRSSAASITIYSCAAKANIQRWSDQWRALRRRHDLLG